MRIPLKVTFKGEEGIDAGGLSNEFFQLICEHIFSKEYGLFTYYEDSRVYYISKFPMLGEDELKLNYTFVGVIFGLAMLNGININNELPDVFFKKLMDVSVQLEDLE